MIYALRDYQQESLDKLYSWWMAHKGERETPLLVLPTAAGKSIIIAELVRLLFDTWPESHPRTIVLVPSKELAEQNAEKLRSMLPGHLSVGFYSASLGKKDALADVIVATIGSIHNAAHLLGNIKCVIIDEAHLINNAATGRYRSFLSDLAKYCNYRAVGLTATPFRGNGVWLTDGDAPFFTGVAHTVKIPHLIDAGFLAPLVRPVDMLTRVDTSKVATVGDDYNIGDLSDVTSEYLSAIAQDTVRLAQDRKKWIAFTPTVENANGLTDALQVLGIQAQVVCGSTPKVERAETIEQFRAGKIRCLVTVLALATGFDVPDVDCIVWARATKSPVLYVQGSGRGFRIAPGKTDCLWLDFTDTTDRLGPIDLVKGHAKKPKQDRAAPSRTCPQCGEIVPASIMVCPSCDYEFPAPEEQKARKASEAPVLSSQIKQVIRDYEVTSARYRLHHKEGSQDSLRVDYYAGLNNVASEWVCLFHGGFAQAKAAKWWSTHMPGSDYPTSIPSAVSLCHIHARTPASITISDSGKFPEIIGKKFVDSVSTIG